MYLHIYEDRLAVTEEKLSDEDMKNLVEGDYFLHLIKFENGVFLRAEIAAEDVEIEEETEDNDAVIETEYDLFWTPVEKL
jgi:hypothetical protein